MKIHERFLTRLRSFKKASSKTPSTLDSLDLDQFTLTNRPLNLSRNSDYISFLHDLSAYLSKNRTDFVALAPYGSQLKGVALPDSDFDVLILGGDSMVTTQNEIGALIHDFGSKYFKKDSNCPVMHDSSYFTINLASGRYCSSEYSHAAWVLAYPFVGNISKVNEFRALLKKRHLRRSKVDPEHAAENFKDTINSILYGEFGIYDGHIPNRSGEVWNKLLLKGYSESDLQNVIVEREQFWRKRVTTLFNE